MTQKAVFAAGITPALSWAKHFLREAGIPVSEAPDWNTGHLLMDVPSFRDGDPLCCSRNLDTLLEALPHDITIWGGNLLPGRLEGYHTVDLLQNEHYLQENAAITADCAIDLLKPMLHNLWQGQHVLVIGWGRIGKSLSEKLKNLGCHVTVAARSDRDLLHLQHLGYSTIHTDRTRDTAAGFPVIINTVPAPVLKSDDTDGHRCIKMDLASVRGIEGEDVLWARGLPGRYAPEQSGRLIADTFLRLWKEEQK